jgi:hypothetical protein
MDYDVRFDRSSRQKDLLSAYVKPKTDKAEVEEEEIELGHPEDAKRSLSNKVHGNRVWTLGGSLVSGGYLIFDAVGKIVSGMTTNNLGDGVGGIIEGSVGGYFAAGGIKEYATLEHKYRAIGKKLVEKMRADSFASIN